MATAVWCVKNVLHFQSLVALVDLPMRLIPSIGARRARTLLVDDIRLVEAITNICDPIPLEPLDCNVGSRRIFTTSRNLDPSLRLTLNGRGHR